MIVLRADVHSITRNADRRPMKATRAEGFVGNSSERQLELSQSGRRKRLHSAKMPVICGQSPIIPCSQKPLRAAGDASS
jgi:hypothetical protein